MAQERFGECWKIEASAAGRPEIFVSPLPADCVEVVAVLVHGLIHAAHPDAGHKMAFKPSALAVGLTGRMNATTPGDKLRHDTVALTDQIGQPNPHGGIHASSTSTNRAPGCSSFSAPVAAT